MSEGLYFVHAETQKEEGENVRVYVDAVFVLNFAINYLLLRASAKLGAAAILKHRLALGALIGACYAVVVYLPGCKWMTFFPCKLLIAALMLCVAFGAKKSTLRLGAVFGALTLVLCGAVYGVQLLQNGQVHYRGDALFYPVSFFTLLLTAAAVSSACRLLLPKLTHSAASVLPVTLRLGSRKVHLSALRDSGNTLSDPIGGGSVLTVYWKAAEPLLPIRLTKEAFSAPAALALRLKELSPRLIPYRAVGTESGLLLALPCEITMENQTKIGLVAFSPTPVSDGGAYEALTGGNVYA